MKTTVLSALFLSTLLLTAGCSSEGDLLGPRVRGVGPTETETRSVGSFSRLELKIDAEVILTQGPQREVRVEAQRNILDVLETEIDGDQLQIEYGHARVVGHDPVRVYVTAPTLDELEVSGSGELRTAAPWLAANQSLRVKVSGSGDADLTLTAADGLRTAISGSGEVKLHGAASSNNVTISGSGKVSAYDLSTQDTYVSISGSGKAYVTAARTLSTDISGSGSVYYHGNPTVSSRISGSGKVVAGQ